MPTKVTPLFTSRKILDINYATPQETLGTQQTLPTSEPTDPQISYTVQNSDLPSFSFTPYAKTFVAHVYGAGKFPTAGTLSWRMLKNGNSVNTGTTSVSANNFYTACVNFLDVAVGDVLGLKLWSSVSDSYWDYKALAIVVTRIIPLKQPLLFPLNFASLTTKPTLTQGNPNVSGTLSLQAVHCDDYLTTALSAAKVFESMYAKNTYGIFRVDRGDVNYANASNNKTSSSYRPYYDVNRVPTQIIMRGIRL